MDSLPMLASLKLRGDDDVDLREEIEAAFNVQFGQTPQGWTTVGDVETALLGRFPYDEVQGGCASQMAFYRLRVWLRSQPGVARDIRPSMRLGDMTRLSRRALGNGLKRDTGLRSGFPASRLAACGYVAVLAGIPAMAFALHLHWLALSAIPLAYFIGRLDPGRYGPMTVGEFARELARLNPGKLMDQGADRRPARIWSQLTETIARVIESIRRA